MMKRGLDVYEEYVNTVVPNLQKSGANAPEPDVVASVVYKAATDNSFRLRYQTSGAKWTLFLRSIIPTRWFNSAVRRYAEKKEDRLKKYAGES
jgi:hypothetical protein